MADTWQTIEQAAVTLGLSVRTVNRHITAGKLPSRLANGRREVLVTPAGAPERTSPEPALASDTAVEAAHENEALKSAVRDAFRRLNTASAELAGDRIDFGRGTDETDADVIDWAFPPLDDEPYQTPLRLEPEARPSQSPPTQRLGAGVPPSKTKPPPQPEPKRPAVVAPPLADDEPAWDPNWAAELEKEPPTAPERATHPPRPAESARTQAPAVDSPRADPPRTAEPPPPPQMQHVHVGPAATAGEAPRGLDATTFLALVDNAADKADLAVSAYQALARAADARVQASRRSARLAWCVVGLMGAGVTVAVGWTTYHLTQAKTESEHLHQRLSTTTEAAVNATKERDLLRGELTDAKEQAARSDERLKAVTEAQAKRDAEAKAEREAARAGARGEGGKAAERKPTLMERGLKFLQGE